MASKNYYAGGHTNPYGDGDGYGHAPDTTYHGPTSQPLDAPPRVEPSPYSSTTYLDDTHQSSHGSGQQRSHANPFRTPFDDDSYSSTYNNSNPSLNHPYQSYSNAHDPFTDGSAIPLQTQSQKFPGPESPITGMGDTEQQFPPDRPKERIPSRQSGWFKKKITWAVYLLSTVQFAVFLGELIKNATLTGSPFEIHPQFNIMIGPSPYVLINMGARYVPCMREYNVTGQGITLADPSVAMPCPNATSNVAQCNLSQLCGFGLDLTPKDGQPQPQPNQWFRFITPIFLHGGIIHIGFNQLLQLTLGRDVERQIGTLRFVLVYFSAGIFGFVLGGNYAPNGIMSSGCSGSLFGIIAIVLLDLLYTWKNRRNPVRELIFIMLDIVVAFVLGLLPGLDNFSHIGGFLAGIVLGICILHSPNALRERIGVENVPYRAAVDDGPEPESGMQNFARAPVGFFKGRKPLWWAWWLIRAGALVAVTVAFIVLLRNFYVYRVTCSWCKYLSCLPVKNWCNLGNLDFQTQSTKLKMMMSRRGELIPF